MGYSTSQDVFRISGLTSDQVLISNVNKYIEEADAWIDEYTRRSYSTATSRIEYHDGVRNNYQSTNLRAVTSHDVSVRNWNQGAILAAKEPYHKDNIVLERSPITSVDRVYFLDRGSIDITKVYSDDGGSFTNNTSEANTVGGTAFYAFATTPALNDALYIGYGSQFEGIKIIFSTVGVGTGITWEYYNGTSWTTLSTTDGTTQLTATGEVTFEAPSDWNKTSVNGSDNLYFIRARVSTASYTTSPTINQIYMLDVIDSEVNTRDIQYTDNGKLFFMQDTVQDGIKNIKVRYKYGTSSVPYNIRRLSASIAAIQALSYMIGGSFDDVTAYTIPEISVSKGEPYTNMRAAIIEIDKQIHGSPEKGIPGLLRMVGKEIDFEVS